ncbi:MAG: hypothetical protein GQ574_27135 [Crocinitomix sp.]|nr:hypothetical protein [Crocinitomix sp.]
MYKSAFLMRNKALFGSKNIALVLFCLCQLSFAYANNSIDNAPEKHVNEANVVNTERDHKDGIRVTLEVLIPEFVAGLANDTRNQEFKKAYDAALERAHMDEGNFIDLFVAEFEKQNVGALLANHFYRHNGYELSRSSSNAEVLDWLNNKKSLTFDEVILVLERRANQFGLAKPKMLRQSSTNQIIIELPGFSDSEAVRNNLVAVAQLGFYEVYDNNLEGIAGAILLGEPQLREALFGEELRSNNPRGETADSLLLAEDRKKKYPISSIMNLAFQFNESGEIFDYQEGSIVGYANIQDTALLNFRLNHVLMRNNLPRDLVFMWDSKEIETDGQPSGVLGLHAIKVPYNGPRVDNRAIKKATINVHVVGQYGLNLIMDEIGAIQWEKMTTDNLNKQIAIIMDNAVLSAPVVNWVMEESTSITGNFTPVEAKGLAALINAGPLPTPIKIVQIIKL